MLVLTNPRYLYQPYTWVILLVVTMGNFSVAIIIDQKCNIQCKHCCFSSGPKSRQHLTDDEILSIIDQSKKYPEISTVGISGGEAMLRKEIVLESISRIKSIGKKSTLTSNGFWGVTPKKAKKTVTDLKNSGLTKLTISYDSFHSEFLNPNRVSNVINSCKEVGLDCSINAAYTLDRPVKESLSLLGMSVEDLKVESFPVTPVGNAKSISPNDIFRKEVNPQDLRCPGFEPTFHFDGNIYPCCSPIIFDTNLVIGSTKETSLDEAIYNIAHNAYFALIRNEGFGWLYKKAVELGYLDKHQTIKVVDVCEMCALLTKDSSFLKSISFDLVDRVKNMNTGISKSVP